MSAFKRLTALAASLENLDGARAVEPAQAPAVAPAADPAQTDEAARVAADAARAADEAAQAAEAQAARAAQAQAEANAGLNADAQGDIELAATTDEEIGIVDEVVEAEEATRSAVDEAEAEIETVGRAVELNEEAVAAAREVADAQPAEAAAILEASNEAIANILGTNEYSLKSISLENVTSDRARRVFLNASMESAEQRSGNIWARIKAFFARIAKAIGELFERFLKLFDFNGRRLRNLSAKLAEAKGYSGRQVIENPRLAKALQLRGKQASVSDVIAYTQEFGAGLERLEKTAKLLRDNIEVIANGDFDKMLDPNAVLKALNLPFINGSTPQATNEVDHLGGVKQVWKIETTDDGTKKITYSLVKEKADAGKEVSLPSYSEVVNLVQKFDKAHDTMVREMKQTRDLYKRIGVFSGAVKAAKAGNSFEDPIAKAMGITRSTVAGIAATNIVIFNEACAAPLRDIVKIYGGIEQAVILLGVSALRLSEGKSADNVEVGATLSIANESIEGVYSSGELAKARTEGPADATQDPNASGKQTAFKDPADGDVNQHPTEAGTAAPKGVVEEFIDSNAGLLVEEQDIVATVEALEELGEIASEQDGLLETVQASEGQGGLDEIGSTLMTASLESIDRRLVRLGVEAPSVKVPSLESFGGIMSRRTATHVSVEAIGERVRNLGSQIKAIVVRFVNWLKNVAFKLYAKFRNLDKQADSLTAKLQAGKQAEGTITDVNVLKAVNSSYGVSQSGILKSLETTAQVSRVVTDAAVTFSEALVAYAAKPDQATVVRSFQEVQGKLPSGTKTQDGVNVIQGLLGGRSLELRLDAQAYKLGVKVVSADLPDPKSAQVPSKADALALVAKVRELFLSGSVVSKDEATARAVMNQMDRFAKANPAKAGEAELGKEARDLAVFVSNGVAQALNLKQAAVPAVLRYAGRAVAGKAEAPKAK